MPKATVSPEVVKIFIKGPQDLVDRLSSTAIVPRVEPLSADIDLSAPGSAQVPVFLELPPGLELTIVPSKVTVRW